MVKPKGVWLQTTELSEIKEATVVSAAPVHKPRHYAEPRRKSPLLAWSLGVCCCALLAIVFVHVFSARAITPVEDTSDVNMGWAYPAELLGQYHTVRVLADGREYLTACVNQTVAGALHQVGLELSELDEVSLPLDMMVETECIVEVNRVYSRMLTETESIAPSQVRVEDTTLSAGESKVLSEGQPGLRENTVKVSYRDGVETGRSVVDSRVVTEPGITTVAYSVVGLASRSGDSTDLGAVLTVGGENFNYTQKLSMESTAYTWTGNRTATGTWPDRGTVAVDPRVIPLGAKLYVEGYGFAIAADTGGVIKGNILDVYLPTHDECVKWGRKYGVAVYILE